MHDVYYYSHTFKEHRYSDYTLVCTAQEHCSGPNDIRLTRYSSDRVGRLEVCAGGLWGTVCGNGATISLVKVACRQLDHATNGGQHIADLLKIM